MSFFGSSTNAASDPKPMEEGLTKPKEETPKQKEYQVCGGSYQIQEIVMFCIPLCFIGLVGLLATEWHKCPALGANAQAYAVTQATVPLILVSIQVYYRVYKCPEGSAPITAPLSTANTVKLYALLIELGLFIWGCECLLERG